MPYTVTINGQEYDYFYVIERWESFKNALDHHILATAGCMPDDGEMAQKFMALQEQAEDLSDELEKYIELIRDDAVGANNGD